MYRKYAICFKCGTSQNFWKTDAWYLKYAVLAVMIFDSVHQVLLVVPTYRYFVKDFGDFDALAKNDM